MFLGFLLGFAFCFICFLVAYAVIRIILFKWGKGISRLVENEVGRLQDKTNPGIDIVYPDLVKEAFNNDATLDDLTNIK